MEYKSHMLNSAEREHKTETFRAMNPFGQVPVLKDGDTVIRDSQAILVYLARAYGADAWFPVDAKKSAEITTWLSTAANEISRGPSALRRHYKFGGEINVDEAKQITENVLQMLNNYLTSNEWLATGTITIADIAIYPYIALANEGGIDLTSFTHIENWMGRIEMLPGFIAMPGIQLCKLKKISSES
jgi:glutathione S-transferase